MNVTLALFSPTPQYKSGAILGNFFFKAEFNCFELSLPSPVAIQKVKKPSLPHYSPIAGERITWVTPFYKSMSAM